MDFGAADFVEPPGQQRPAPPINCGVAHGRFSFLSLGPSVGRRALDQLIHPNKETVSIDNSDLERRRENHSQKEEPPELPALILVRDVLFCHRLSQNILSDALTEADATNMTTDAIEAETTPYAYSPTNRVPLQNGRIFRFGRHFLTMT